MVMWPGFWVLIIFKNLKIQILLIYIKEMIIGLM